MASATEASGLAQTENVSAKVKPQDPRTSGFDPITGWAKLTHQLGLVAPRRMDAIRQARESFLPSVKV